MRKVKIGLCGFTVAMADYARSFPVVEVQQTFYQPPTDAVMARWRKAMPADFEFTIKAWQLITHPAKSPTYRRLRTALSEAERRAAGSFRDTAVVASAWRTTLACAQRLSASAVLFQCPASFKPADENVANLDAFFRRRERPPRLRMLWEPRGPWPADVVASLCAAHDLVHVVDPFVTSTVTPGITYYRLHGVTGARHAYTDDELARLRGMLPEEGETYVMFNNIPRARDARRFGQLLGVE